MGLAARMVQDINTLVLQLNHILQECIKAPRFQTAMLCQQVFFNPQNAFNRTGLTDAQATKLAEAQERYTRFSGEDYYKQDTQPTRFKALQDNLDAVRINSILQHDKRAKLRNLIKQLQHTLIKLINPNNSHWYNTPLDFNTEFKDFMANNDYNIAPMFASLAGLLATTTLNPDSIDAAFDVDARPDYTPPGINYATQLIKDDHPLAKTIFPTQAQYEHVRNKTAEIPYYALTIRKATCTKEDRGTTNYQPSMMAIGLAAMHKNVDFIYESLNTINESLHKIRNVAQREEGMQRIVHWLYTSASPDYLNMLVLRTGEVDSDFNEFKILGFEEQKIQAYAEHSKADKKTIIPANLTHNESAAISRLKKENLPLSAELQSKLKAQPINLIYQAVNDNQHSQSEAQEHVYTTAQQAKQGEVLKQFTPADVENNTGASVHDEAAIETLHHEIREGELGKQLDQPVFVMMKETMTSQYVNALSKSASVLLLGMTVANLATVREEMARRSSEPGKLAAMVEPLFYTAYAIEIVYIRFKGMEHVERLYQTILAKTSLGEGWITTFRENIGDITYGSKLTPLAIAGLGACAISAIFDIDELIHDIKQQKYAQAVADLLNLSADVFQALAILIEYAAEETMWSSLASVLGPVGWIAALLGLVAVIIANAFSETPLAHWTKHCPLSNVLPDTSVSEYESCTSLLSILQTPTAGISLVSAVSNESYQTIELYVHLPCFDITKTDLQIETTWEREKISTMVIPGALPAVMTDGSAQQPITPIQIKQCCDAQGRVVGMRYIYVDVPVNPRNEISGMMTSSIKIHYRTRLRLYCEQHQYSLPYVAGTKHAASEETNNKVQGINPEEAGWYYCEATY
jgi:hypothetical protein